MDIKRTALQKLIWAFWLQHILVLLYLLYEFRIDVDASPLISGKFWGRFLDLVTNPYFDVPYYALAYGGIYLYYYLTSKCSQGVS